MIEVVPATARHVNRIAKGMAAIDAKECRTMGHSPKEALRLGLRQSTVAGTVMLDGQPIAMFGVVTSSLITGAGRVWLLMTDEARAQSKALVVLGRKITEALHNEFDILHNHVHADNRRAVRWLRFLGYEVGPVVEIRGEKMRYFERCVTR